MRARYDFARGVRGKYAARFAEGTNVVVLDSDVASVFRDRRAVNEILRTVIRMMEIQSGKVAPARRRKRSQGN